MSSGAVMNMQMPPDASSATSECESGFKRPLANPRRSPASTVADMAAKK